MAELTCPPGEPAKLSWQKKLLFSVVPLVLLLCIAEVICRLFPHRDRGNTVAGLVVPDPDLIWRLKPNQSGEAATNELGLRDTAYNWRADVKILLLGDSVSWGDGVLLEQGFPHLLERRLNELDVITTYEVINAGVVGYSTFQQAAYLRLHGLKLKPDLVVLQFCLNDVVERYHALAEYGGDNIFLGIDTREAGHGAYGFLLRHSRAFERCMRLAQRLARKREEYDVRNMARDQLSPEMTEAWQRTIDELEDIRRTAAENAIPFLLVIAPYRFQLDDPTRCRQPQDYLMEYARSQNVWCVDLLPGFVEEQRRLSSFHLFNDPNHFSRLGHRTAARLLVKPVRDALRSARRMDRSN